MVCCLWKDQQHEFFSFQIDGVQYRTVELLAKNEPHEETWPRVDVGGCFVRKTHVGSNAKSCACSARPPSKLKTQVKIIGFLGVFSTVVDVYLPE